jgi:hypothetical protein
MTTAKKQTKQTKGRKQTATPTPQPEPAPAPTVVQVVPAGAMTQPDAQALVNAMAEANAFEPAAEPAPVEAGPVETPALAPDVEVRATVIARVLRIRVGSKEHWPTEAELRDLVLHEDGTASFKLKAATARRWGVIGKAA